MKTKLGLTTLAGILILLGLPGVAQAQCNNPTFDIVLADGRPRAITIAFNVSGTFVSGVLFRAAPGRSYSVEVFAEESLFVSEVFLGAANATTCPLTNAAGVRVTTDIEPRGVFGSVPMRFSFTATAPITSSTSPFYIVRMRNPSSGTAPTVTITVSDTTLFSPRWSTFGGFFSSWAFHNTTNATITGNLRVINNTGTEVANVTFPILSGQVVFRDTRATNLNLAANQAGNAIFTHNGPPGAIQADAFFLNAAATVVVPGQFEPVRQH